MANIRLYNTTLNRYELSPTVIYSVDTSDASGGNRHYTFEIKMYYSYDYINNRLGCYFTYTGTATNGGFSSSNKANLKVNNIQIFDLTYNENTNYSWTSPTYYFNCNDDGSYNSLNTVTANKYSTVSYVYKLNPLYGIYYKILGVWKKVVPKLKVLGVWKRCIVWKKINGVWKRGK